ncbi:MAG: hypothetical protein L0Z73_07645 [Gammaproteobacteria bacterium]|nr:hypothetical protein [Gammaproteobacteria bacterium]
MRIGYLSSRLIVTINILGIIVCLLTTAWIVLTHTDLTPDKTERVFQKNIKEANDIRNLDAFRQVHQSVLLSHKREQDSHYENVKPIYWLAIVGILIFTLNTYIFWQLVKEKSIRIR